MLWLLTQVVVFFLLHPMLTRIALKFFTCSPEDMGRSFLEADFATECWTNDHWVKALGLGGSILLLYAFGIPTFAGFLLIRAKREGLDKWRPTLGFL